MFQLLSDVKTNYRLIVYVKIFIKGLLSQKHIHAFLAYLGTLILIPPKALSGVYTGNNTIDIFAIHWLWQFL